jgi:predicted secreted protein
MLANVIRFFIALVFIIITVIVGIALGSVMLPILAIVAGIVFLAGFAAYKTIQFIAGNSGGTSIAGGSGRVPASTKTALRDARHYARLIKETATHCPPGPMRDRLTRTVKPVDEWLANLLRLEQALGKMHAQRNLSRDVSKANYEIEQLRRQILGAQNADEVASLRALMKSKRGHLNAMEELQRFQQQAELKIRRIASDLGAAHAEMLLLTTKGDFSENRFQRLDENLQENMSSLRDMLSVMDEMSYVSRAAG